MDWIQLGQNWIQWRVIVKTIQNILIS